MKEHVSFMKEPMNHFVAFMEASDRWCNNYDVTMKIFICLICFSQKTIRMLQSLPMTWWMDGVTKEAARTHNQGIPV